MNSEAVLSGKIEVRFGWDAYPKQYSGGLIAGLRNPSTDIFLYLPNSPKEQPVAI